MRWRVLAPVLLGLLLPVPLLAIIGSAWLEAHRPPVPRPSAATLVPMLSEEERHQRITWRQPCRRSEDCEPPLACFFDRRVQGLYCSDSDCVTDAQCGEGFVCGAVETWGGEVLRRCLLEGARREGEGCEPLARRQERTCARGLLCNQWCGRPCQPETAGSCPEGFFCPSEGGPEGPSCLPSCEGRGCPPGQACTRFRGGSSVCSRVRGTNCQQAPCPEGQHCETSRFPERAGGVWMRCEAPCSSEGAPCPDGSFCLSPRCVRACEPDPPGPCGPGERCARLRDGTRWACLFDDEA